MYKQTILKRHLAYRIKIRLTKSSTLPIGVVQGSSRRSDHRPPCSCWSGSSGCPPSGGCPSCGRCRSGRPPGGCWSGRPPGSRSPGGSGRRDRLLGAQIIGD